MPGIAVHFTLARATLEDWRRRGCLPFDPGDAAVLDAFHQGAVGPDLGYFPGGVRELSELGLDAWYAARRPEVGRVRLRCDGGRGRSDFLVRAFGATYGIGFEPEPFERSLRATARRVGQALASFPILRGLMGEGVRAEVDG